MIEKFCPPPKIPQKIISRFFPENEITFLHGDFDEIYNILLEKQGKRAADHWYWIQLIRWIPVITFNSIKWSIVMLKNYLTVTLRNLKRQKGYTFINLAGLSVGIACALLILLVVQYEFKYESHHKNADRIFRLNMEHHRPEGIHQVSSSPVPLAETLYNEVPEITHFTRMNNMYQCLVAYENQKFYEDNLSIVDPGILEMFSFQFLSGDKQTALKDANSVIITESMAKKYFGNVDPMGKTLNMLNSISLKVTGIIRDLPAYSNIRPEFLLSFATLKGVAPDSYFQNWLSHQIKSFVMLSEKNSPVEVEKKIQDAFLQHVREDDNRVVRLDQLSRMHLFSSAEPTGNINSLYILLIVGGLILLAASINFMNLATARSSNRAKEVGLRKVVGASRKQLIRQFVGESLIYTAISIFLAFFLCLAFLPVLNNLTGQSILSNDLFNSGILSGTIGIFLMVGILSGSYPAFFLSAFQPAGVLRGSHKGGYRGALFRKILVVVQFAISILLIISTIIFSKQLNYLLNKPLGFEKDQVVIIRNDRNALGRDLQPLKSALLSNPHIGGVTGSYMLPSSIGMYNEVTWEGAVNDELIEIIHNRVDYDFLDTYGIELIAGRNFSPEFRTDLRIDDSNPQSIIINEEAVRRFGWENPIGKKVFQIFGERRIPFIVIGVIKDFHFSSLRESIQPLKLFLSNQTNRYISVKIQTEDISESMKFIEKTWKEIFPDFPFDYFFYDSVFERRYQSEANQRELFGYFSGLAIFIGCLGLLGLAAYAAERRTKEIGIRKVLGASPMKIIRLLSKDFSYLVLAANLIAWPAAYLAMRHWLNGFAYRIDLSHQWIFFILAGSIALVIALLSVGLQAAKAALTDPAQALKYE